MSGGPTNTSRIASLEERVEQLMTSLTDVTAHNTTLQDTIDALRSQVQHRQPSVDTVTPSTNSANVNSDRDVGVKPATPDTFNGQRAKLESFITQVKLAIELQPRKFQSERTKVMYMASFLRDTALQWFQPLLGQDPTPTVLTTFPLFIEGLRTNFGDPDRKATAERKLYELRQRGSAAEYLTQFQQHSTLLDWDDSAKASKFYHGLKDSIKDELARIGRPNNWDELTQAAIRIDNRLFERAIERGTTPSTIRPSSAPPARTFTPRTTTPSTFTPSRTTTPFQRSTPPPQQRRENHLQRNGKLTPEEYKRRQDAGHCVYCGDTTHKVDKCPLSKPRPTPASVKAMMAAQVNTEQKQGNA